VVVAHRRASANSAPRVLVTMNHDKVRLQGCAHGERQREPEAEARDVPPDAPLFGLHPVWHPPDDARPPGNVVQAVDRLRPPPLCLTEE
jgi:hypothetical protein